MQKGYIEKESPLVARAVHCLSSLMFCSYDYDFCSYDRIVIDTIVGIDIVCAINDSLNDRTSPASGYFV